LFRNGEKGVIEMTTTTQFMAETELTADNCMKGAYATAHATYPIGTQYMSAGKHKRLCTVVDIHKTYNHANELVKIRYVATHEFMGQVVTERDVVATTIARGIV
jgi:hypothetical protein